MSERLTKRTKNGGVQFSNGEYWNTVYPQNKNCLTDIHRMAIKLCEIEDKIEQGKILELPCKVGQTVYRIYWNFNIDECKVSALTQKADKSWKIRITSGINRGVFEITPDELGKTVFLTKEEAERVLERREE